MSDEFDDVPDPVVAAAVPTSAVVNGRAPRLLARLYVSANQALRTRLVACLVRPLGPLAIELGRGVAPRKRDGQAAAR